MSKCKDRRLPMVQWWGIFLFLFQCRISIILILYRCCPVSLHQELFFWEQVCKTVWVFGMGNSLVFSLFYCLSLGISDSMQTTNGDPACIQCVYHVSWSCLTSTARCNIKYHPTPCFQQSSLTTKFTNVHVSHSLVMSFPCEYCCIFSQTLMCWYLFSCGI